MDGVKLTLLKQIEHPKGNILHAMKCSDTGFSGFGEAYFSEIKPGEIKGWKKHQKMILNIIVAIGEIKFVIYCEDNDKFFEVILSKKNYQRLTIAPNLWVAFQGLASQQNMLINIANIEHDPNESLNVPIDEFEYEWS